MIRRPAVAALAAALAIAPAPVDAQDAPKPPVAPAPAPAPADAAAQKEAKVRRLLELQRFRDFFFAGLDASIEQQVNAGMLPPEFPAKFKEVADLAGLEKIAVEAWSEAIDEPSLDAALVFFESEAGRKFVDAGFAVTTGIVTKVEPWAAENARRTMEALGGGEMEDAGESGEDLTTEVLKTLKEAKLSANETNAIATLRNLASCQAHIQTSGKIDCDRDGIGEYGTFLELTGSAGVRNGFAEGKGDFSKQGTNVNPPIMAQSLAGADASGVVRKSGYCFRIFLPDAAAPSRFTHETGPAEKIGLAGGTANVLVDLAEMTWCAYAWPETIGDTGRRAFFTNQAGDVMQSSNEAAKWEGAKSPPGNSAFLGDGITAPVAVGTRARDGDVWKVAY